MPSLTFNPGAPVVDTNHCTWQDRDPPVGLVDASVLSGDALPKYVQRLRLWRDGRFRNIYLNAKSEVPDGGNAFGVGDDLSDAWEAYSAAIVISAPNGILTIPGPNSDETLNYDSIESYSWPVTDAALNAWLTPYLALSAEDQALVTVTLTDGVVATPETHAVDAGGMGWSFGISEPTVRRTPPAVATLLPSNATPLERALEAAIRPRADEDVIRRVWDPWACEAHLLPWLAWQLSVDYWEDAWTEHQKRAVIAASIEVHRRKGTPGAMRRIVESLGYGFQLVEWWELNPEGTPCTAEAFIFRQDAGRPIAAQGLRLATRLLDDAKRGTLHLAVTAAHQVSARAYLYARADAHKYQSFSYTASRIRFAEAATATIYLYARADAYEHQHFTYTVER